MYGNWFGGFGPPGEAAYVFPVGTWCFVLRIPAGWRPFIAERLLFPTVHMLTAEPWSGDDHVRLGSFRAVSDADHIGVMRLTDRGNARGSRGACAACRFRAMPGHAQTNQAGSSVIRHRKDVLSA
ncbi:hypothetical protein GCM10027028_04920 [Streptomyces sundarbansensis]